jgi:glycosyltransferase involved in cell wall biosynthesis
MGERPKRDLFSIRALGRACFGINVDGGTYRLPRMKILFIAPMDSAHAIRWINRVQGQGVECLAYDMTEAHEKLPTPNLDVHRSENLKGIAHRLPVLGRFLKVLRHGYALKKLIKSERPDLVHIHWLFHPAALAMNFIPGVPVVGTPWGSDLLTPTYKKNPSRLDSLMNRISVSLTIRRCTAFCCDANHMREELVRRGASAEIVELIYFGTDTEVFKPSRFSWHFRKSNGVSENEMLIVHNRVLADMYDIETFLYAVKELFHLNNIKFMLVGGGPSRQKLENLTESLRLKSKVIFTGRLSDEDFITATASCDIYVSTAPTDGGLAASVAEAMACGKPVILTRFGDNPMWTKNETAGRLFDVGDFRKLSEIIQELSENPQIRQELGVRAREVIVRENSALTETAKTMALYRKVLGVNLDERPSK